MFLSVSSVYAYALCCGWYRGRRLTDGRSRVCANIWALRRDRATFRRRLVPCIWWRRRWRRKDRRLRPVRCNQVSLIRPNYFLLYRTIKLVYTLSHYYEVFYAFSSVTSGWLSPSLYREYFCPFPFCSCVLKPCAFSSPRARRKRIKTVYAWYKEALYEEDLGDVLE